MGVMTSLGEGCGGGEGVSAERFKIVPVENQTVSHQCQHFKDRNLTKRHPCRFIFFTLSKPKPNQKKCNVCKSGNAVALIIMFGCKMFKVSVEIFLPNITGEMASLKILLRTYTQY